MIRTLLMLAFWTVALPVSAVLCFPWTFITGDIRFLYRVAMWSAWNGVRLAGIKVETVGLDRLDPQRNYVFMSNHVSNIDPPIMVPLIPRRTSVMVKKELFNYPLLGRTMRLGRWFRWIGETARRALRRCDPRRRFCVRASI